MLIGVPREIKTQEFRVGMTPSAAREAVAHGHHVLIETQAGAGIGASDNDYRNAGAEVANSADEVFAKAELMVKVKEPQAVERRMLDLNGDGTVNSPDIALLLASWGRPDFDLTGNAIVDSADIARLLAGW